MPAFAWKGRSRAGDAQSGAVTAESRAAAEKMLQRSGISVASIRAQAPLAGLMLRRVRPRVVAVFTRQLSVMIGAGLPLVQCLDILAAQQDDGAFRDIVHEVRHDVEGGATLHAALAKHPRAFNDLYVNMVGAGEQGALDVILQRLAAYQEKSVRLAGRVRGAMAYPATVLAIAAIVVYVIMVRVVPVFTQLFEGSGGLPAATRLCVAASDALLRYGWVAMAAAAALGASLRLYYGTARGRLGVDRALLKAPVLGGMLLKLAVARFCRTLGTLVSSGVPILEGMDITAGAAGNRVVQAAVLKCRDAVEKGRNIAAPLAETRVFPQMVVQMVAVGEATNALDAMLAKVADFYDDEVDNAVAALTAMMEPLIIVVLGVVIGFVVVSMYMPIFSLGGVMGD
jgi:type IV pilus assembly protein PilC